jgi:uroporphyrinogen III methyltransferase/synthase
MSDGLVYLVGAGPGDPGLLTLRAAAALARADVLLYDALASETIVTMTPPACERIFVAKQDEIQALMLRKAREGKVVVCLKSGDPFVFGYGGEDVQTLNAHRIPFEIIPGVPAAIAAPAYAGIPVIYRDYSSAFTVSTDYEDLGKRGTHVFLLSADKLETIAERLMQRGLVPETPAAVIQNGTRPSQLTVTGTIETIAQAARSKGLSGPAILVAGEVVRLRELLRWFDSRPLFGKRVLITRPAHQADQFARTLYARGVEPILASTIAIVPPDDVHPSHRAIDELALYGWIVFTSQNGVDAFFDRISSLDADARYIGSTKVAAIGAKTAERLRERGIRADLVPSAFISEEIGRTLIEASNDGERILIYRAQEARDVLPQMLEDAGRRPTVVSAYKTIFDVDPHFAEKVKIADVLTFTSASTVRGFVELLGGVERAVDSARGKVVACIGPVTAEAAEGAGLHVDVVADVYTTEGLLDALEAHLSLFA